MSQLQDNLNRAIELSQHIIDLAKGSSWQEMEQADQQRMSILKSIFDDEQLKANPADFEPQVQQLLELNEQALTLCGDARGELSQKGRKLKQGRDAIAAYKKNT
jgi:murein L,D-transpeptidase YcbB/YkuD